MRRMDRYKEDENLIRNSRMDKNQDLYHNLSSNSIYTNITDVKNANAFEINNRMNETSHTTREAYQQMQKYQDMEPMPRNRKELEDVNYLSQKKENKTYDINSFLEEARRNRTDKDDLDGKRKLKNNAYNILASINKEQLEKYREEKKNRIRTPEEEEIRDLTEDLLSKTMAGEIDKETTVDLLSDLMATNLLDTVVGAKDEAFDTTEIIDESEVSNTSEVDTKRIDNPTGTMTLTEESIEEFDKTLENTKENRLSRSAEIPTGTFAARDKDFYTRSMDLSDKDFDLGSEYNDKKLPVLVKIIIALLIIAIIVVAAYFIYQRML